MTGGTVALCDADPALIPSGTPDGVIGSSEYAGFSNGVGVDFGGKLGAGAKLYVNSDSTGALAFGLDAPNALGTDDIVIYFDSTTGGFSSTANFTDTADDGRKAISGFDGSNRAALTFAPNFTADYAIVVQSSFVGLFKLAQNGSHTYVKTLASAKAGGVIEFSGLTLADLGSQFGNDVHYVATVLNPNGAYRSGEFQGVAASPGAAIGATAYALAAGDYNSFVSMNGVATLGQPFRRSFDTFTGAGFAPTPACGQLNANNWAGTVPTMDYGVGATSGEWARGQTTSSVTTGGAYAFVQSNGNRLLGMQPSGAFWFNGSLTLRLQNTTSASVVGVDVAYSLFARNDQATSATMSLSYSTNGTTFTSVSGFDYATTSAAAVFSLEADGSRVGGLGALVVPSGGYLYLRFSGSYTGTGQGDEFGFDDLTVTPHFNVCGDGIVADSEQCDTITSTGTCGCTAACVFPAATVACGDSSSGACDEPDTCDGAGACVTHHANSGTSCADGTVCNGAEVCDNNGACTAGTPLVCNDGNVCTDDACSPTVGCFVTNNTASCNDGNACTADDVCGGGVCGGGSTVGCSDGNVCTTDACNPASGCEYVNNTVSCDDSNACTSGDVCAAGACVAGAPLSCGDSNECTTDACNPSSGCTYTANVGAPCNGSPSGDCDAQDTCDSSGSCQAVFASSSTVCRLASGSCDVPEFCTGGSAQCPSDGRAADNTPCSDGLSCTTGELCLGGTCTGGFAIVCADDGNACTMDVCDESTGCGHLAIPGCCHTPADCDDGDACTADLCPADGTMCQHIDNGTCVDGGSDAGTDEDAGVDGGTDEDGGVDAGFDGGFGGGSGSTGGGTGSTGGGTGTTGGGSGTTGGGSGTTGGGSGTTGGGTGTTGGGAGTTGGGSGTTGGGTGTTGGGTGTTGGGTGTTGGGTGTTGGGTGTTGGGSGTTGGGSGVTGGGTGTTGGGSGETGGGSGSTGGGSGTTGGGTGTTGGGTGTTGGGSGVTGGGSGSTGGGSGSTGGGSGSTGGGSTAGGAGGGGDDQGGGCGCTTVDPTLFIGFALLLVARRRRVS